MEIREEVPLAPLTTFGVGGAARFFAVAKSEEDVTKAVAWAKERGLPLFVLGGGSNLLIRDEGFDGLVLRMEIGGIKGLGEGRFEVGAGESWDGFVQRMVDAGFAGVECMAGIPGSVEERRCKMSARTGRKFPRRLRACGPSIVRPEILSS